MLTQENHPCASEENLTLFLSTLQPEINRIARSMYYRIFSVSLCLDDLAQEGLIGAWHATTRYNPNIARDVETLRRYCLVFARGHMLHHVRSQRREKAWSLEDYLERHLSFQI